MSLVSIVDGLIFPVIFNGGSVILQTGVLTALTAQNAATDKVAMIGYAKIVGRGTKTLDTSGSSAISFGLSTVTFANGSTTVDVGIQDVDLTTGPPAQPDGTFDVKTTLTGGGGGLATGWNNVALSAGSGTKTIAHGDLIAIVIDMTARAGADTLQLLASSNSTNVLPVTNVFDASAWGAGTESAPNVVLTFSDGTLGTLDGALIYTNSSAVETFADATNPDERGNIFQVPWQAKVDALWAVLGVTDGSSDFTITLYSDPLGTPVSVAAVTVDASTMGGAGGQSMGIFPLASEVTLSAGTNYCVAVKANGSTNCRMFMYAVSSASYMALHSGGTTLSKGTRNNSTGVFSATTTSFYPAGVRISAVNDSGGSGGGGTIPRGLHAIETGI